MQKCGSIERLVRLVFGVGRSNSSFSRGTLPACKHWGIWGSQRSFPATVEKNSIPKSVLMIPVGTRAAITDSMQKWSVQSLWPRRSPNRKKGGGPRSHQAYQNMFLSNFMRKLRYETKIYRNFLLPKTYHLA